MKIRQQPLPQYRIPGVKLPLKNASENPRIVIFSVNIANFRIRLRARNVKNFHKTRTLIIIFSFVILYTIEYASALIASRKLSVYRNALIIITV